MIQERYAACLRACELCADSCNHCAISCLDEARVASMARCIRLNLECALLCRTAAEAIARDGEFLDAVLGLCGQVCASCRDECRSHEADRCQACATACHLCMEECEALARTQHR